MATRRRVSEIVKEMTKPKIFWTAEEIIGCSNYIYLCNIGKGRCDGCKIKDKQFLDADEVKRIIETMDLCCTKHTYKVNDRCDIMNIKLLTRLGLR